MYKGREGPHLPSISEADVVCLDGCLEQMQMQLFQWRRWWGLAWPLCLCSSTSPILRWFRVATSRSSSATWPVCPDCSHRPRRSARRSTSSPPSVQCLFAAKPCPSAFGSQSGPCHRRTPGMQCACRF